MRVLVIGAGRVGATVILQLQKNADISILVADPRPRLYAVEQGIIDKVDIREPLTPLSVEHILQQTRPDLVLLAMPTEDMGLGRAPGIEILAGALRDEIAALASAPVIEVARKVR